MTFILNRRCQEGITIHIEREGKVKRSLTALNCLHIIATEFVFTLSSSLIWIKTIVVHFVCAFGIMACNSMDADIWNVLLQHKIKMATTDNRHGNYNPNWNYKICYCQNIVFSPLSFASLSAVSGEIAVHSFVSGGVISDARALNHWKTFQLRTKWRKKTSNWYETAT